MSTNENTIKLVIQSHVIDNRIYVPLRAFAEAVGLEVTYKRADHTIHATTKEQHAIFLPGSSIMSFNGERKEIGSPVVSRDGQVQVPLRFITELLGWHVHWDEDSILLTPAGEAI